MSRTQKIYAFDAFDDEGLPAYGEREVDVLITDPPYSRKVHECGRRGISADYVERHGGTVVSKRAQFSRTRELGFEHLTEELREMTAQQAARIVRRWALVFTDVESVDGWRFDLERYGLEYVRTLFWVKQRAAPQFTGDRPASHVEAIVLAHQTDRGKPIKKRWNGGGKGNVFTEPVVMNSKKGARTRVHSAQKPLRLMRDLVHLFSDRGELVVDPFAGSGTTGVACRQLDRNFVGFERSPDVAAIAATRIRRTLPTLERLQ